MADGSVWVMDDMGPADIVAGLDAMRAVLDAVVDAPAWRLSDAELTGAALDAHGLLGAVTELVARLLVQVDARGLGEAGGATSTGPGCAHAPNSRRRPRTRWCGSGTP